jgi:hypothetical protein
MRALTVTAVVRPDHTLTVQVPADIPPGTHQVVVVLQEDASPPRRDRFTADWPVHQSGPVDANMTFRREDIYGDDGR